MFRLVNETCEARIAASLPAGDCLKMSGGGELFCIFIAATRSKWCGDDAMIGQEQPVFFAFRAG
jgi:hypothetical protein